MRDPSIHIKESDLIELLKDYIPKGKVLEITKKAKKYACIKRSMVATNQKQRRRLLKINLLATVEAIKIDEKKY